jgi:hypothetical protein
MLGVIVLSPFLDGGLCLSHLAGTSREGNLAEG